ncbi:MAG: radical SAM protein [Ignavibacteria bacterium]|nr:radical SAM protein [Ignavibacteria bacterium]
MNRVISHPAFAAAKAAFESNDYISAEDKCTELLDRKEIPHLAYLLLGKIYLKLNKTIEALVFLEKAFNLDKCNIEIGYELAKVYYDLGYFKQSAEIVSNVDIQNPSQDLMNTLKLKLKTKGNKESTNLITKLEEFNKSIPTTFTFETVLACNLKCPECAIGHGLINRKREWVTFDKFKIIADKVKPFVKYFYLHLWGEPMLNKDIFKIIKYASSFSKTNISTNALLIDEKKAELLIQSGVSDLIVSIDGYSQEAYEKYRIGGNISKVFDALNYLVSFNKTYGNKVNIIPQFIVFKHNQHELGAFRAYCQSLGLTPLFKSPYIRQNDSDVEPSDFGEYRREEYENLDLLKQAMSNCVNPKEVFTVNVDGSVVICCHDYNKQTNFGNLFEQDVLEIWNGPDYRKYRWDILRGNAPEFCIENCMTYKLKQVDQNKNNNADLKQKTDEIKVNLCSGAYNFKDYINVDIAKSADVVLDLERELLPFNEESVDVLVCMSAINYFSRERGFEIIKDIYRVLRKGGIVRVGTQDLELLVSKYLNKDEAFFFQKNPDGKDRFPGNTYGEKLNNWFYGFECNSKLCKYVYDYETLAVLFKRAGFRNVERKKYCDSRIKNIELIDNRPEQMFYLEAVKEECENSEGISGLIFNRAEVEKLWQYNKEQAWQIIIQALNFNPRAKVVILLGGKLLQSINKYDEAQKLYATFLDDVEIAELYRNCINHIKAIEPNVVTNYTMPGLYHQNKIYADQVHLEACIKWLIKAFEATKYKGVSASYNLYTRKWDVAYPETTGYIIPTFLHYYRITKKQEYKDYAVMMGDWEMAIQWENGGVGEPIGVIAHKPRVFNTGQVMLGWLALYQETGKTEYLDASIRAGNWIAEIQREDGSWNMNTYRGPKSYKVRVAWALLELYKITNINKYKTAAEKAIKWTLSQARPNGWFDNTSLSDEGKPWTHLIGYTMVGLLEVCRMDLANVDQKQILNLLNEAALGMGKYYGKFKDLSKNYYGLPGTFDNKWSSTDNWSCLTGNAQLEFFFRKLYKFTGHKEYENIANNLIDDVKRAHLIDSIDDPNLFGGLAGSYPLNGGYSAYTIPNWGVKFFADSLLQRLLDNEQLNYLS